jgi:hypothetical protein
MTCAAMCCSTSPTLALRRCHQAMAQQRGPAGQERDGVRVLTSDEPSHSHDLDLPFGLQVRANRAQERAISNLKSGRFGQSDDGVTGWLADGRQDDHCLAIP